jgi:hypothetical protein
VGHRRGVWCGWGVGARRGVALVAAISRRRRLRRSAVRLVGATGCRGVPLPVVATPGPVYSARAVGRARPLARWRAAVAGLRRRMPGRGGLRHPHGPASATPASTCRGTGKPQADRFPELSCEGAQRRGRSNPVCPVEADVPSRVRGYPAVEEVLGQTLLARRPTLLHTILSSSRRSVVTARCGHQLSRASSASRSLYVSTSPPAAVQGPASWKREGNVSAPDARGAANCVFELLKKRLAALL